MNRKCYIITFYLISGGTNASLEEAIKNYGTWAKITDRTWAIVTSQSATEVRNALDPHLTVQDRIFVVKSGLEAAWRNVECSSEWLKTNL